MKRSTETRPSKRWTHSLLMTALWGVLFGTIYRVLKRDKRGALILLVLVISHWVFDLVTHRPDLPLTPNGRTQESEIGKM